DQQGRCGGHDRLRVHRADREGAADGVRGRDEPPDPAPDGGLGRMTTAANLPVTAGFDGEWGERALARAAAAHEPKWALERRRAAAGLARTLPFPSHEDELWRRTDFRALQAALPKLDPFAAPERARGVSDLPDAIVGRLAGG